MAKRNQQAQQQSGNDQPPSTTEALRAQPSFVEGLASSPPPPLEAIAAANAAITEAIVSQNLTPGHADLIAAFYAGKRLGALDVLTKLENNWGREVHVAVTEERRKLEAVQA